jgi:hypothetical protein
MIEIKRVSRTGRDETAAYECILTEELTVGEFLAKLLQGNNEFGYLKVDGDYNTRIEYGKFARVTDTVLLHADKKVLSVSANGGWGRMDYYIKTK